MSATDPRDKEIDEALDRLLKLLLPGMDGSFGVENIECKVALEQDTPIELRRIKLSVDGLWIDGGVR